MNSALLVIDMQEFFFVENPEVNHKELARSCNEIMETCRQAAVPVIHVNTVYRQDRLDWPQAWRDDGESWCANLVRDNDLCATVDGIGSEKQDIHIEKRRFSAFYNTNLDDVLRSIGCDHIFVVGYSADVCVRFTSVDAYNRGYTVTLVYEGIESFKETRDDSVEYLGWLIDAKCVSLELAKKQILHAAV